MTKCASNTESIAKHGVKSKELAKQLSLQCTLLFPPPCSSPGCGSAGAKPASPVAPAPLLAQPVSRLLGMNKPPQEYPNKEKHFPAV